MQRLLKLWPFVRPFRRDLVVAVVAAVVAAALWAGALLLIFPITKVLKKRQNLGEYFVTTIADAERDVDWQWQRLVQTDQAIADLPALHNDRPEEQSRLLQERGRILSRLEQAGRQVWWTRQRHAWLSPLFPEDQFQTLALLFVGLAVISSAHGGAVYFQEVWIGRIAQCALRSVRAKLFRATLKLDVQTLAVEGTPALMSRFTNDLAGIAHALSLLGGKVVLEPFKAGACLLSAFVINWRLTLLSLICAPIGALVFSYFGTRLKRASRRQMETVARLYAVLQETLGSFRVVAAFENQHWHRRKLASENREYFKKAMQINRIDALTNPMVEMLGILAACLAVLPGAYLVIRHKTQIFGIQLTAAPMDLEELAVLYTLLAGILDPARKLSSVFSKVKKGFAACDRVFEWMDRRPLLDETTDPRLTVAHSQSLEFDDVSFRYYSAASDVPREPALHRVSLKLAFGEVVAIVGGNGSGKSTLVGLLPRFYDPQAGTVRIDGVDVRQLSLRGLRDQLGWIPQEPQLFDRTLAENIAFGRPQATRAEIDDVARRAHVMDFAATMPQGLDTPAGEKGNRLSGGQRQRVALARAMLRDPAVLILDEATSAIDALSEQLIFESLREFVRGRTTLVITHTMPPALREIVTRIVVMERGQILAVGKHDELLQVCPTYVALAQAQTARRAA